MRNNAILNSYFSSFRTASFVISSFRLALFRLFVISRGIFRYFVFSPGVILSFRPARTPSEKTKRRKNAMRKDEITKRRHAKRQNNATRNNEITPCEITKRRQAKRRQNEILPLTRLPKMHRWFLVCCIIGNVNVKVKCVDLDRAALVWAVWATREV